MRTGISLPLKLHFIHSGKYFIQFVENSCLISCFIQKLFLSLPLFHADNASLDALDGWDDILEKAFAKRFDFDCVELRNL